jgi:hypothetical protein
MEQPKMAVTKLDFDIVSSIKMSKHRVKWLLLVWTVTNSRSVLPEYP